MADPRAFFEANAGDAAIASQRTGVPASVILAQWGLETGYGTSRAWRQGNNFAGVSPGGRLADYPSRGAGLEAYISTLLNGRYAPVRSAGDPAAAARALGESPWAESHYGGGGAQLLTIMRTYGLDRYDAQRAGWGPGGHLPEALDPRNVPEALGRAPGAIVDAIEDRLLDGLRELMLPALFLFAAGGLVLAGAWRMAAPTIKAKAAQAVDIGATVASGGASKAAGATKAAAAGGATTKAAAGGATKAAAKKAAKR